jgi:hypothetical protein
MISDPGGYFARMTSSNNYFDRAFDRNKPVSETRNLERAYAEMMPRLLPGGVLLADGCGTGEHLDFFRERGVSVLGVEPSPRRRACAEGRGMAVVDATFENLSHENLPILGGAWCGAALRHVPTEMFSRSVLHISQALPFGAPVYLMVALGEGAQWVRLEESEDDAASFIQRLPLAYVMQVLEQKSLEIVASWTDEAATTPMLSLVAVRR